MAEGWIKLYREITDHWIWEDPFKLRAWLDLIMLANHKPKKILINGQLTTIDVGQHWTSYEQLALRWKCSKNRVVRLLKLLNDDEMITYKPTPNGTLINIVNYRVYQGFSEDSETPTDTPTDTPTRRGRIYGRTTNKNDKRMIKNEKKATAQTTQFQNFDQRSYDYEALEERLVNK